VRSGGHDRHARSFTTIAGWASDVPGELPAQLYNDVAQT